MTPPTTEPTREQLLANIEKLKTWPGYLNAQERNETFDAILRALRSPVGSAAQGGADEVYNPHRVPESVENQVRRLCNRLNSDDPDFDDCSEAARMLRWLADKYNATPSPVKVSAQELEALEAGSKAMYRQSRHTNSAAGYEFSDTQLAFLERAEKEFAQSTLLTDLRARFTGGV